MAGGAGQLSTLLSRAGFDSVLLLGSAVLLLLSTLGVLIACKIVLGLLLAAGPIFIALMLFETTQGLFEGWLRAALGFAFAPLAVTVLLGFGLVLLEPSLQQIETMRGQAQYIPGVGFGVAVMVTALAGVSLGLVAAGGVIAAGFRLPRAVRPSVPSTPAATPSPVAAQPCPEPHGSDGGRDPGPGPTRRRIAAVAGRLSGAGHECDRAQVHSQPNTTLLAQSRRA